MPHAHISRSTRATRKTEKAADDQWRLGLENSIRTAKGKPPALSLDQLDELIEAEDKAKEELAEQGTSTEEGANDPNRAPAKIEFVEDDAMLEEAGQILLDLIGLSTQIANNTPAESKVAAAILPLSQPTAGAVNQKIPTASARWDDQPAALKTRAMQRTSGAH